MDINNVSNQNMSSNWEMQTHKETKTNESETKNIEVGSDKSMDKKISSTGRENEFTAVSKDGDTLEISGKNMVKMTDAALAKCSKSKLKQLLQNGSISREQYDKAMMKNKDTVTTDKE